MALSNYNNGIYDFDEYDPSDMCESFCDPEECWHIDNWGFENQDMCFRTGFHDSFWITQTGQT